MSSRANGLLIVLLSISCTISYSAWADDAASSSQVSTASNQVITNTEIDAAIKALKKDPNLATEYKTRTLRWIGKQTKKEKPPSEKPDWSNGLIGWLQEFFSWVIETGRILVWTVAFIMAAVLVVWLLRYIRTRQPGSQKLAAVFPTHVRELDIRPESLPDDIGNAARALWQASLHREALSLLYRGCLSRLVHTHRVAIKQSSTEGECVALAAAKLDSIRHRYVATLIRIWLQAVYGNNETSDAAFSELCAGFSEALDGPSVTDSANLAGVPA